MKTRLLRRALAGAAALTLIGGTAALASDWEVALVDVSPPTGAVTLEAGSHGNIAINLTVSGKQDGTATFKVYTDWTLANGTFTGSDPEMFTISPQAAGTETKLSTTGTVFVTAGQAAGDYTLNVGVFDITNTNATGAKLDKGQSGTYVVSVKASSNTKPTLAITGIANGPNYEFGVDTVPVAMCVVTDDHDVVEPFPATLSGSLSHGLGTVTATCDYKDSGNLAADTATASYTIRDTAKPTISHTLSAQPNGNGWYKDDVTVTFECADTPGSGIKSCVADGEAGASKTLYEGADQSISGTATDWAGNTATDTAFGINIDKTAPALGVTGATSGSYDACSIPSRPTSAPSDALSGLAGLGTESWSTPNSASGVGSYTYTASATDLAGNSATETRTYAVNYGGAFGGFLQPINSDGKSRFKLGSTIPVKFQLVCGGTPVTGAIAKLMVKKADGTADPGVDEAISTAAATSGNLFRFSDSQYIFNLSTKTGYLNPNSATPISFALGTWTITAVLDDGTTRSVDFQLIK